MATRNARLTIALSARLALTVVALSSQPGMTAEKAPVARHAKKSAAEQPAAEPTRAIPEPKGFRFKNGWMLEWGMSPAIAEGNVFIPLSPAEEKNARYITPHKLSCPGSDYCSGDSSILPEPYFRGTFNFHEGRFYQALAIFLPERFPVVLSSLTEALGKPDDVQTNTVQNGFGAQFDQVIAHWKAGNVEITAWMRGIKVNEGITIMTYLPTAEAIKNHEPKAQAPF